MSQVSETVPITTSFLDIDEDDPARDVVGRPVDELPVRVQRLVESETQAATVRTAWFMLAIVGFLGLLYALSPKALDGMTAFKPVPVAVFLLIVVSLARLFAAYRGLMTRPAVTVFIIADFALFYGLIWSFHLQYEQPPAFYLKAPTFLFVFMLIAIQAMRLEPWSILVAGLVAAGGWAMMAVYAIRTTPEAITRDFTGYLTSNSILIGSEVEKIVAILLVTLALTLAVQRARRQLVAAAVGRTAREELSRFFPPEIAERIATGEHALEAGQGQVVRAGIVVCDIRGFTQLAARRHPADVMRILIDYQQKMGAVIAAQGGAIDKFLGDGVLATFGCTRGTATPAADALRAAVALVHAATRLRRKALAKYGEDIRIGIAVTVGPVLFGTVGDQERLEFTVIGEPVNLAVKIEKQNKALMSSLVTDQATFDAAVAEGFEDDGSFRVAPACGIDGVAEPIALIFRASPPEDEP